MLTKLRRRGAPTRARRAATRAVAITLAAALTGGLAVTLGPAAAAEESAPIEQESPVPEPTDPAEPTTDPADETDDAQPDAQPETDGTAVDEPAESTDDADSEIGTDDAATATPTPTRAARAAATSTWSPKLEVFAADGTTPLGSTQVYTGDTIVVRGSGYDPEAHVGARPPAPGVHSGVYVVFGHFAEVWQESKGAPSSARSAGPQKWAMSSAALDAVPAMFQGTIRADWVELTPAGEFEATLTIAEPRNGEVPGGEYGVYTYAASGAVNADQELKVAVSYDPDAVSPTPTPKPTPTTPTTPPTTPSKPDSSAKPTTGSGQLSDVPADGEIEPGDQVTIVAKGFQPNESGIVLELHSDPVVLATNLRADADGVVRYTVTIPQGAPAGQHTLVLIGETHTARIPVVIAEPEPVCVARVVSGGTLTWGVNAGFRQYITGSVANGSISASGVGGSGPWTWSGGSGTYNTDDTVGRVAFAGGVRFTGHGGVLDVEVSNLRVQVRNASSGNLIGDIRTGSTSRNGIVLATLNLAAGSASASGSQVSWSGVPATLTAAGAAGFEGFYSAGEAMDPVSFTLPLGAETDCTVFSGGGLASTGADVDGGDLTLAGALTMLGILLVVAANLRRRGFRPALAVTAR